MAEKSEFELEVEQERILKLRELMKKHKNETVSVRVSTETLDLVKASLASANIESPTEFLRSALMDKLLGITVAESVLKLIHDDIEGSRFMENKVNESINKMETKMNNAIQVMCTLVKESTEENTKSIELITKKISEFTFLIEENA